MRGSKLLSESSTTKFRCQNSVSCFESLSYSLPSSSNDFKRLIGIISHDSIETIRSLCARITLLRAGSNQRSMYSATKDTGKKISDMCIGLKGVAKPSQGLKLKRLSLSRSIVLSKKQKIQCCLMIGQRQLIFGISKIFITTNRFVLMTPLRERQTGMIKLDPVYLQQHINSGRVIHPGILIELTAICWRLALFIPAPNVALMILSMLHETDLKKLGNT